MKNKNGITLIALVITIIVLLILAGVSISSITGEDGLLFRASNSKEKTETAQREELEEMKSAENQILEATGQMSSITIGEYSGTSNKKYEEGGKTAIIPAGFTVSNLEGETSIAKGLVIYSGNQEGKDLSTIQNSVNQYVWIPVDTPSDLYGTVTQEAVDLNPDKGLVVGEKFGKLYEFGNSTDGFITSSSDATHYNWPTEEGYLSSGTDVSHREPAVLKDNDIENGLKSEFDNMTASVEKYKGFYIGRYELSSTGVVRETKPLSSVSWDTYYEESAKLETSNTDAAEKVTTTMIWGCQYDQVIKMSLTDKSDFLTNAGAYGVYDADNVANTGSTQSVFNIFDLSGNVWECTLEACNTGYRVRRGNRYYGEADQYPASQRNQASYGGSSSNGCRVQLYIDV